jgi:hypothetical protein
MPLASDRPTEKVSHPLWTVHLVPQDPGIVNSLLAKPSGEGFANPELGDSFD